jgi:hypothetical protein
MITRSVVALPVVGSKHERSIAKRLSRSVTNAGCHRGSSATRLLFSIKESAGRTQHAIGRLQDAPVVGVVEVPE